MYERDEIVLLEDQAPDSVEVGRLHHTGIYCSHELVADEAAVIRRWRLPFEREVLGIFWEVGPREDSENPVEPGGSL